LKLAEQGICTRGGFKFWQLLAITIITNTTDC